MSVFGARVLLVAALQGALQVQKTEEVFSFARVGPSRAFALVPSRAIAASRAQGKQDSIEAGAERNR